MKCPMTFQLEIKDGETPEEDELLLAGAECDKEECAWWVETQDRCAIKDIALSLGFISTDMTQMLEKMPRVD